ncbi:MAG: FAD-dependent oxidoreductase [Gracilibacteraceae bacterium]|jgi:fumarate reductase flavoprotein subunit|nr:FAD-dependent oxidoreductase [Gracilibacteraceae bacterium]
MTEKKTGITRRNFLKTVAAGAVGVAAAGVLGGCSSSGAAGGTPAAGGGAAPSVSETQETDIVVVGGGSSGLCAAVQAAQLGAGVILLEANSVIGGNGQLTEGMFAIGSSLQRASGVGLDLTFREVVAVEQEFFNYRVNALFWKDLVENSADNLEWLIENGVQFSGVVDNYYGLGKIPAFHWFVDGSGRNYIGPMAAKAEELGVQILLKTPGDDLIQDETGKVAGIYAKKEDGTLMQINCKAVILASGGYANNMEMMEARGYDMTYTINQGNPHHNGDGLRMATKAGGADVSLQRCFLREPYAYGTNFFGDMSQAIQRGGPLLWVNQDAERYCNEDCGAFTPGNNSNAVHTQQKSFLIFDRPWLENLAQTVENLVQDVEDAVAECPGENIYKADTIEELATLAGLDPAALAATLARYNTLCAQGLDEDFNKPAEKMVALTTGPYYIFRQDLSFWTSIGGIHTNRRMEVIDLAGSRVPGLYAAGTDGCELYRETYTMNVPASCNGNNCNSGRVAAKNAVAEFVQA